MDEPLIIPDPPERSKPVPPINRNGGKPGARKPSEYLRALRFVSRSDSDAEDTSPLHRMFRKEKNENPIDFLDRLAKAEVEHKRSVAMMTAKMTRKERSDAARSKSAPVTVTVEVDVGEEKALQLLDKLLGTKGWNK